MRKPSRIHDYSSHHALEPDRWDQFLPRDNDVVVTTSLRSGTTWVQVIVANLIFQNGNFPSAIGDLSPWYELRLHPFEPLLEKLESQNHRRLIKSHLPLNGLNFYEQIKYIVVGRDTRDVFMSLKHHFNGYSDEAISKISAYNQLIGRSFPPNMGNDKNFWKKWISSSWFEWEADGYPYWSHLNYAQSWWEYRKLPNILLVNFEDLLKDTESEIKRIANFLNIKINKEHAQAINKRTEFQEISRTMDKILPEMKTMLRDGPSDYMYKEANGLWRDFLNQDDLVLYNNAIKRTLSPDCARWLEKGRHANNIEL